MNGSQKIFISGLIALAVSIMIEIALGVMARLLTSNVPLTPDQPNFDLISGLGWLSMAFFAVSFLVACVTFVLGWRSRAALMESVSVGRLWKIYKILFIILFILTVAGFGTIYLIISYLGPVR